MPLETANGGEAKLFTDVGQGIRPGNNGASPLPDGRVCKSFGRTVSASISPVIVAPACLINFRRDGFIKTPLNYTVTTKP